MNVWLGLSPYDEPPEVAALRHQSDEVLRVLASVAGDNPKTIQPLLGVQALVGQLRRLAPAAARSSWVLQPEYSYDPEDPGVALTRSLRARGVETELITLPSTVATHPLLSSIFPNTLLGPVFLRSLVIDGRHAIVGGPPDAAGRRVAWYTTVPDVVDAVIDLWKATVPLCRPILEPGKRPPLSERQLEVARLMCVGEKDQTIARALGLSPRTVEREVHRILEALGASSRTEAVLLMRGRGVNGGRQDDDGTGGQPTSSPTSR
jgi:DNA-binding CsgD family transcriptional regulator